MTFMPIVNRGSVTRQCYYWCSTTGLAGLSRHCCDWYGLQLHCSKWRTHCTVKFCLYPTVPPLVDNVFDIRNLQKGEWKNVKGKNKNTWMIDSGQPPILPHKIYFVHQNVFWTCPGLPPTKIILQNQIFEITEKKNTDSVKFTENLQNYWFISFISTENINLYV